MWELPAHTSTSRYSPIHYHYPPLSTKTPPLPTDAPLKPYYSPPISCNSSQIPLQSLTTPHKVLPLSTIPHKVPPLLTNTPPKPYHSPLLPTPVFVDAKPPLLTFQRFRHRLLVSKVEVSTLSNFIGEICVANVRPTVNRP